MNGWRALLAACALAAPAAALARPSPPIPPGVPTLGVPVACAPWPAWTRIQIQASPGALGQLRENPRGWVRVEAVFNDEPSIPGRLRIKGTRGSLRTLDEDPSLTLVLDHAPSGLGSTTRFHLENGAEDPASVRAAWGAEAFALAGIPAPRHGWGTVRLNGRNLGWRGVKEGFDESLARWAWPGANVVLAEPREGADLGDALEYQGSTHGAARDDAARAWRNLGEALNRGGWEAGGPWVDGGRFLKFAAVEVLLGHRDGYVLARNNYRVAFVEGRFEWVPWGLDTLLETPGLTVWPGMAGRMARPVLLGEASRTAWWETLREWAPVVLDVARLDAWIRRSEEGLRGRTEGAGLGEWRDQAGRLRKAVLERGAAVAAELALGVPSEARVGPGGLRPEGWRAQAVPPDGAARTSKEDGRDVLELVAGARNSSSWVATLRLAPGRYRFSGRARVMEFRPLPGAFYQGAVLRVANGADRSRSLHEPGDWKELQADFRVGEPRDEVSLMCEFRASHGRAWFDRASLLLERLE